MAAEHQMLHMTIDADARLAAAAGGVARFLAEEAGLETNAVSRLQSTIIEACKEAFQQLLGNHAHLEITFARFSDRLEVSLSREGELSSSDRPEPAQPLAGQKGKSLANSPLAGVDRVQYETHGKEFVTRLTKYFGEGGTEFLAIP